MAHLCEMYRRSIPPELPIQMAGADDLDREILIPSPELS
jgi:hypothetical protein